MADGALRPVGPERTFETLLTFLPITSIGQGYSNVIGLALFYAIMAGSDAMTAATNEGGHHPMEKLAKLYTACINQEAAKSSLNVKTHASDFLEQYGDMHIDALEKRLSDFINAASDVSLHGVPFVGPPRNTSTNVLLACKEILENNAVRIKLDGGLHPRVDMQLILFENAARRLESMEADGGTPEAVSSGSVFTACAKLIRSLYRIMWQWKRSYSLQNSQLYACQQQPVAVTQAAVPTVATTWPAVSTGMDEPDLDGFDFDSWPQLSQAEMSNLFTFEFDANLPGFPGSGF
jgi:hypothetical protein